MASNKKATRPPASKASSNPRKRAFLFGVGAAICVAALVAVAWWIYSMRPAKSAGGTDLGRSIAGVPASRLNLLVITLDTTRADRISAYGYGSVPTPNIDRLASEGVLFEQTMAVAPLTLPAHCSIFTSKFPPEHGVRDNGGFFLSPGQTTLASVLEKRGFRTGAVVAAYVLDHKWGLSQGFENYVDNFDLTGVKGFALGDIQRPGNEVVDLAMPWLEKVKGQQFFGWLHFYDPHTPYEPPEPFASRYPRNPYSAEIAFADAQIGRVLDFLERNGLMDKTIIAVIGDHGEGLNQHQEGSHCFFVYESTIRVPFIIRAPFAGMRGRRVADPVRSVDLMPTVLDLMGIQPPRGISGVSLAPLMTGARQTMDLEGYAEALYPLHHFGWSELRAWRAGRYKVIDAPRPEMYDLQRDPGEEKNIYGERKTVADQMIARLRQRERDSANDPTAAKPTQEVDPETRQKLAALGYVGSFVATVSESNSDRADPKDKIELFNLMGQARESSKDKEGKDNFEKVVGLYKKVLADDPNVIDAWFNLGNAYQKEHRYREAIDYFKHALELKPDYDLPMINLANCYRRLGDTDAALLGYEHYLKVDPTNAGVMYEVGEIYMDKGDVQRAEQSFRQALATDPNQAPSRNALGVIAFRRGDLATSEREVKAAIDLKKDVRLAHYNLALIAEERNDLQTAEAEYKRELELHSDAYRAAFNLGRLYERMGNRQGQMDMLKRAVDMDAEGYEARVFLAKAYLDSGTNLPDAMKLARAALDIEPRSQLSPLAHYILADLYNRLGRVQDASREVTLARSLERRR